MIKLEPVYTRKMVVVDCVLCGQEVELQNGYAVILDDEIVSNICGLCEDAEKIDLKRLEQIVQMSDSMMTVWSSKTPPERQK